MSAISIAPVALFELDETDPQFHKTDTKGRSPRFIVEQIDGDQYGFTNRAAADRFMDIHGMEPVDDSTMAKCRMEAQAMKQPKAPATPPPPPPPPPKK